MKILRSKTSQSFYLWILYQRIISYLSTFCSFYYIPFFYEGFLLSILVSFFVLEFVSRNFRIFDLGSRWSHGCRKGGSNDNDQTCKLTSKKWEFERFYYEFIK
ncbi:hypothetical protein DPV73_15690 [Leptospira mayottensis]|nr:hypothetical protein DPV73_15690 [Leptospira mayottensis]